MSKKKNPSANSAKSHNYSSSAESGFSLRAKIDEFRVFFEQSKNEMKKVTYPGQKQTLYTCGSVLFIVAFIGLFLGLSDIILSRIVEIFLP